MKQRFESHFSKYNLKVSYINYCYDIEKMIQCDKKLKELSRKKGMYKLHLKKYMKENNITKEQVAANPRLVPPPTVRVGFCKKEVLNLQNIERENQ